VVNQSCWSDEEQATLTIGEASHFEMSVILPFDTALFPRKFMVAALERRCANVQEVCECAGGVRVCRTFSRERRDIDFEVQLRKHTFV
jgi:hypothetical protein